MIRVGMLGGRGYVGAELLQLLLESEDFEPVFVGSSTMAGELLSAVHPEIGDSELRFSAMDQASILEARAEAWVLALPNGQAAHYAAMLDPTDARLIDISADFRFHRDWVYGLPEVNAAQIGGAGRVANPGCYATGSQLALHPMLDEMESAPTVFGVSGFSGAGNRPSDKNDPQRLADNLLAYQLTGHTHEREICHQLGRRVHFMPHVAQFFRGISLTVSVTARQPVDRSALIERYRNFYAAHSLVQVSEAIPEIQEVRLTNDCRIGGFAIDDADARRFVVVSVLDNLRKGAASQAMQNLNLMFGLESTKGLTCD